MRYALMFAMSLMIGGSLSAAEPAAEKKDAAKENWVSLFNGKDLTGWTPKIRYQKAGENWKNTFRVEDGLLKVRYDQYDKFNECFGHLYTNDLYSKYRIRLEYRFVDEQCPGGPGWALRNSGIMVHGQKPETMALDQDFPVSIEVQLLGGDGKKDRTTGNLCTPGTNVVMDGKLFTPHCVNSKSKTYTATNGSPPRSKSTATRSSSTSSTAKQFSNTANRSSIRKPRRR